MARARALGSDQASPQLCKPAAWGVGGREARTRRLREVGAGKQDSVVPAKEVTKSVLSVGVGLGQVSPEKWMGTARI